MKEKKYKIQREFFSNFEWYDIIAKQAELPPVDVVIDTNGDVNPEFKEYFDCDEFELKHSNMAFTQYYVLCEFLVQYSPSDVLSEEIHLFVDKHKYQNFEFKGDEDGLGFIVDIYDDKRETVIDSMLLLFDDYDGKRNFK
ncbi:MAG: hypothetical protein ACOCVF_00950 [bacterium]